MISEARLVALRNKFVGKYGSQDVFDLIDEVKRQRNILKIIAQIENPNGMSPVIQLVRNALGWTRRAEDGLEPRQTQGNRGSARFKRRKADLEPQHATPA